MATADGGGACATGNSQTLQYLQNLPEYMASTVDTALVVEDVIYPVHSFTCYLRHPYLLTW